MHEAARDEQMQRSSESSSEASPCRFSWQNVAWLGRFLMSLKFELDKIVLGASSRSEEKGNIHIGKAANGKDKTGPHQ